MVVVAWKLESLKHGSMEACNYGTMEAWILESFNYGIMEAWKYIYIEE